MSHHCIGDLPSDAYGAAILECWEAPLFGQRADTAGQFWVGNGEYWSQVNFCPFCGARAMVPVLGSVAAFKEWNLAIEAAAQAVEKIDDRSGIDHGGPAAIRKLMR